MAQCGSHEVGGEDRSADSQGCRQQHGVECGFNRAEGWYAEFWLKNHICRRGLPDVFRLFITLVCQTFCQSADQETSGCSLAMRQTGLTLGFL